MAIVAVARVVDLVLFVWLGHSQSALTQAEAGGHLYEDSPADPGLFTVLTNWDGQWYRTIAEDGYPDALPRSSTGEVEQNAWAFLPLYPALVRGVMLLTTLDFGVAAWLVSLVAGTAGMCVLYRFLLPGLGTFGAAATIAGLNAFPAAPVLQMAYTEGLALLLVVLALRFLRTRRYRWFCVVVLLLGLTRPIAIALAPVAAAHALVRWRQRRESPLSRRDVAWLAGAVSVPVIAFAAWPLTAAAVLGDLRAYPDTQGAWARAQDQSGWPSWLVLAITDGPATAFTALVLVALLAHLLLQPDARLWPGEMRTWGAAYVSFLVVSARPTSSIIRYALLLPFLGWPLPEAARTASARTRACVLIGLLAIGAVGHYFWIRTYAVIEIGTTGGYP